MNRKETLALYEQGVDAWNKWANEMLEERKKLEETAEWRTNSNNEPQNQLTKEWFEKATANFSTFEDHHTFNMDADFSNFIFPSKLLLSSCKFKGTSSFHSAHFHEEVEFNDTNFKSTAWFNNAIFQKISFFHNSEFHGEAYFSLVKFKEEVAFNNSKFFRDTYLDAASFNSNANFLDAKFFGSISFNDAEFHNSATFLLAKFEKSCWFSSALFKKNAEFYNTEFFNEPDFNAITSEGAFSLEKAEFHDKVPNFIQANFKEAPRLDNIEFGDDVAPGNFKNSITTFIHPDIKARYQALKRLAVQAHDHEDEQRFWAGELRSDRSLRIENGGWNLRPLVSAFWWGNIAYGCFSDYGRSIVRPLSTLLVLVILMTGLHLSVSKEPLTYENTFSAGYISASKSIFNLGADPTKRSILKEKYSALYGVTENQTPDIPKSILIAEMGQTLLSAIFIFLTLLGVRNNFKMK